MPAVPCKLTLELRTGYAGWRECVGVVIRQLALLVLLLYVALLGRV